MVSTVGEEGTREERSLGVDGKGRRSLDFLLQTAGNCFL